MVWCSLHRKEILLSEPGRNRRECILTRNLPLYLRFPFLWMKKFRMIVASLLFVQGCKRAEKKTYSPLDDRLVILTTLQAFHYFRVRRDEIRFAFDPPKFVDKITVEGRVSDSLGYIILKRFCTKFWQKVRVWPKELPKHFPKLVISVTLCQVWKWFEDF